MKEVIITKKILKDVSGYIIIIVVVVAIRAFFITPVRVDGASMDDTLKDSDLLLLNKIVYRVNDIKRYDIVVIENKGEKIIKRVYGLPGEKIVYKDNILYIDDTIVIDEYASNETSDFTIKDICHNGLRMSGKVDEEIIDKECNYDVIPDNYYLVLGDNRKVSADSRNYGLIPKDRIIGRAKLRFWPFDKIGFVK